MSLTATSRSIRTTLRQEILIDGKHRLITDEPESVGGDGSAPAPHELFPAALASCISTTLVMYARTKEWDLGDVTVDVEYDHHATPRTFEIAIAPHRRTERRPTRPAGKGRRRLSGSPLDRVRDRVPRADPVAGVVGPLIEVPVLVSLVYVATLARRGSRGDPCSWPDQATKSRVGGSATGQRTTGNVGNRRATAGNRNGSTRHNGHQPARFSEACHAEARGFESHHPLSRKPRKRGFSLAGGCSAQRYTFDTGRLGVGEASHAKGVEQAEEAREDGYDEGDLEGAVSRASC